MFNPSSTSQNHDSGPKLEVTEDTQSSKDADPEDVDGETLAESQAMGTISNLGTNTKRVDVAPSSDTMFQVQNTHRKKNTFKRLMDKARGLRGVGARSKAANGGERKSQGVATITDEHPHDADYGGIFDGAGERGEFMIRTAMERGIVRPGELGLPPLANGKGKAKNATLQQTLEDIDEMAESMIQSAISTGALTPKTLRPRAVSRGREPCPRPRLTRTIVDNPASHPEEKLALPINRGVENVQLESTRSSQATEKPDAISGSRSVTKPKQSVE